MRNTTVNKYQAPNTKFQIVCDLVLEIWSLASKEAFHRLTQKLGFATAWRDKFLAPRFNYTAV
jgi:hypothetical protein